MLKILVTWSAISHLGWGWRFIILSHLFRNWLGMPCKDLTICFFPRYHTTLSGQSFYMFSALYLKKSSSFLFAALSFWNTEAQGTTSSTPYALMSREPWLPSLPSFPLRPKTGLNTRSRVLNNTQTGSRAIYTTQRSLFPISGGWASINSLSKLICSHSTGYQYTLFSLWSKLSLG